MSTVRLSFASAIARPEPSPDVANFCDLENNYLAESVVTGWFHREICNGAARRVLDKWSRGRRVRPPRMGRPRGVRLSCQAADRTLAAGPLYGLAPLRRVL